MTLSSRSRAKKRLKHGKKEYSEAGNNIKRDLSPTTQQIIQEQRIYLLITEDTDLSVNGDAPVEIDDALKSVKSCRRTQETRKEQQHRTTGQFRKGRL